MYTFNRFVAKIVCSEVIGVVLQKGKIRRPAELNILINVHQFKDTIALQVLDVKPHMRDESLRSEVRIATTMAIVTSHLAP